LGKNLIILVLSSLVVLEAGVIWQYQSRPINDIGPMMTATPTFQSFIGKAKRASVLSTLMSFKMEVMVHYMEQGEFPASASDIGLDMSELKSKEIAQVQIDHGRVIAIPAGHEQGWIGLFPTPTMGGRNIDWECKTNIESYSDGQCGFDAQAYSLLKPSFDCQQASSVVEEAICREDELMRLDQRLNDAYDSLLSQVPGQQRAKIKNEQLVWVKNREGSCSAEEGRRAIAACIESMTEARGKELLESTPN